VGLTVTQAIDAYSYKMNRSIDQALITLLPTLSSAPPKPLRELATSFLAQSRHKASTLKAEEEIARPYACAHIACNRSEFFQQQFLRVHT
jgi:hypothetical protein